MISRARSLVLGVELRRSRERAGLSGVELARMLGWSQTKVTNMERGNRTVSEFDVARYLAFCRENDDQSRRLLSLFVVHDGHWVQPHTDEPDVSIADAEAPQVPLRDDMLSLSVLECAAKEIHFLDLFAVPALLQTPEYLGALLRECHAASERVIRTLVRARRERLSRLSSTGPRKLQFFVHENALQVSVGGVQVMEDQLLHLVFQASESEPDVTLRIIPRAAGPHAGLDGGFCLMEYERHQPIVYVDHGRVSLFVDTPEAAKHYRSILARLDSVAASEEETRGLLLALV